MRSVFLGLCVVTVVFSGCDSSDSGTAGGDAGAAGADVGGGAGAPDAAGAAGVVEVAGAGGESACATSGTGTLKLTIGGLPAGVEPSIELRGPDGSIVATAPTTLDAAPSGLYTLTVKRVYDADPIVRTAYEGGSGSDCLGSSGLDLSFDYAKIPSSNQLWALSGPSGEAPLLGFASSTLAATGAPLPGGTVDAPVGNSLAFDFDGNLWAGGATVGDPTVVRYPASVLGGGPGAADVAFTVPAITCVPAIKGIALDATGNLWLSTCDTSVLRIAKGEFMPQADAAARDVDPSVTLSGLSAATEDLAFDAAGNLWLASQDKVLRFDKARLAHDDAAAPDLTLSVTTDDVTPKDLASNFLAFDKTGNLWSLDFAANTVFEIPKAALVGTGTSMAVSPKHVVVDVAAVLARPAFDDAGALWLPLAKGTFGKLTPALLAVNTDAGAPTTPAIVISSAAVDYADGLAFFPAAQGLPLASAQP
jgi:hypothetical protein